MWFVVVAALLWSAIAPLSRLALASGLAPLHVAFGRALVAGIAFGAHLAVRGGAVPRRSDAPAVVAFAGLGVALLFALNQVAVRQGGAALATVLLYSAPVWVALVGPLVGEPRRRGGTVRGLVAAGGIALLASGGGTVRPTPLALLAGLGSGAAYAFYSLVARRLLQHSSAPGLFAVAMPLAAAFLLAFGGAPTAPSATQALLVVAIGLLSFGGSLCFGLGLARLPAARAALLATIEPLSAAILAGIFFGERFGVAGMAGAALIGLAQREAGDDERDAAVGEEQREPARDVAEAHPAGQPDEDSFRIGERDRIRQRL